MDLGAVSLRTDLSTGRVAFFAILHAHRLLFEVTQKELRAMASRRLSSADMVDLPWGSTVCGAFGMGGEPGKSVFAGARTTGRKAAARPTAPVPWRWTRACRRIGRLLGHTHVCDTRRARRALRWARTWPSTGS